MPLQIPVTQTGLEASIEAAAKKAGRNLRIDLGTNAKSINALSQPLGRITGQADEFTKSMEAANARVFAFGASVGIINGVTKAFSSLVKNTIEVEKSLVEINTVLNRSGDALQDFGNKLFDVAKTTGQTFDVVAKGALELARQGLNTEDTLKRINDALILSRLSGLDAQQSVEGLTAAFNSFKETGITTSQILNKLVVVSQKYSVSERDLIEGLKRSASVADQAGVSFDELVGIITTVQERTARGGAVIGNAFKTIFARIQDTGALQDLANLGIQVTDLEGKVLPATRILQNLGAEFNNLSQLEQADIAKKLGGVYQLSNLLAAVKDLSSEQSKYNDIVKLSAGATNEAYQKNAALNETLAALINKVSLSAQQLGATLGAIGITDNLKQLLDFFNKILEGIQGILGEESMLGDMFRGLAKGIGSVLAGPGLALFGAIIAKLSKDLIGFGIESLKSFFKIGQAAKDIERLQGSIASTLLKNKDIQAQILSLEGNRVAQAKFFTAALNEQYSVMQKMQGIAASVAPAVYGGTRGGRGGTSKNAAGGYMPAVSQESRDINRGVGGARGGDKPVVIPNFAFGGGKKGTMVAHTGEYIVPNFAAGGSAIFNRDMVRSMGLPAGAKKIGAAGGFVPNFAATEDEINAKIAQWRVSSNTGEKALRKVLSAEKPDPIGKAAAERLLAEKEKQEGSVINAESIIGRLPAVLAPVGKASIGGMKLRRGYGKDKIDFAFSGYTTSQSGIDKLQTQFERRFSDDAIKTFAKERALLAAQQVAAAVGSEPVAPKTIEDISDKDVKGFLSSVRGAMGGIFDAAVSSALRIKAQTGVEQGDFDIRGLNAGQVEKIETLFGEKVLPPSGLADFKIGFGQSTTKSMVDKTIKEYRPKIDSYIEKRDLQAEAINKADIKTASKKAATASTATGSNGYIPNFVGKSREVGRGVQGAFYKLGNQKDGTQVGVKKFFKDGPSRAVEFEWLVAEYLSKHTKIPAVFGPKNLSTLQDSVRKQSIRKELVSDPLAKNALGSRVSEMFGRGVLFNALQAQGLSIGDLHGSNYTVNANAENAINELGNFPQNATGAFSTLRDMASKGSRIGILDTGAARVSDPARTVIGKILAQQSSRAASGFIPNFALSLSQMKELRSAYGKKIIRSKDKPAYYSPSKDEIQVARERRGPFSPFFTALHEIGHATDNASGPEFKVIQELGKERRFDMLTNKAYFANLALEVRANLQVVKALQKAKASQQDIESYIKHATHYIQGYLNAPGHEYIDTRKYGKVDKKGFVPYGTGENLTSKRSFNFLEEIRELMRSAGKVGSRSVRKTRSNAAGGYIPNFADPLKEAIGREMSAGVPASQIYVDQNSSLKNSMNPMGLMVANRRDEPAGGMQGINRARKEGANPMLYGAAGGFVPNYAVSKIGEVTKNNSNLAFGTSNQQIASFNKGLENITVGLRNGSIKFNEAMSQVSKLASATGQNTTQVKKLESAGKSLMGAYNSELTIRNQKAQELKKQRANSSMGPAAVGTADSKAPRDFLGTIFAVQAGLSLLTGATEGATSELGKYTNIISGGIGTASSILFAFQGLGSALPKFAGFLGPAGIAVTAVTAAFQIGKGVFLELSGANKRAADASKVLAIASEKAALRLDELGGSGKQDVERTVEDIIKKLNIQSNESEMPKLKEAISAALLGTSRTDVENILKANLKPTKEAVLSGERSRYPGSGVSGINGVGGVGGVGGVTPNDSQIILKDVLGGEITNAVKKLADASTTGAGNILTRDFLPLATKAQSPEELKNLISTELGKNLKGFNLGDGLIKEIFDPEALLKAKDQLKQLSLSEDPNKINLLMGEGKPPYDWMNQPNSQLVPEEPSELTKFLKENNVSYTTALELINEINKAREQQAGAEGEASAAAKTASSKQLEQTIRDIKIESNLRKKLFQQTNKANNAQIAADSDIANIKSDITLSELERNKLIGRRQFQLEKDLAILENQKSEMTEIVNLAKQISESSLIGIGDKVGATEQAKTAIKALSEGSINETTRVADVPQMLKDLGVIDFGLIQNEAVLQDILIAALKVKEAAAKTKEELGQQNNFKEKGLSLAEAEAKVNENNSRVFEKMQNTMSAIADDRAADARRLGYQSQLVEAEKDVKLAKLETSDSAMSSSKRIEQQRLIEREAFNKQLELNTRKSVVEAEADFIRNSKVQDNIIALQNNNTALEKNTNALLGVVSNNVDSGAFNAKMEGGNLIGAANMAINNGIFNSVNEQADNCSMVIRAFAKEIGISTNGVNDLANSWQNFGVEIEKNTGPQPGDILVKTRGGGPNDPGGHVGMYLGNGEVLQASMSASQQGGGKQAVTRTGYDAGYWDMIRRGGNMTTTAPTQIPSMVSPEDQMKKAREFSSLTTSTEILAKAREYTEELKLQDASAESVANQIKDFALRIKEVGEEKALQEMLQKSKETAEDLRDVIKSISKSEKLSLETQLKDFEESPITFKEGMENGFLALQVKQAQFGYNLGKEIPELFSQGMSDAITSAITGAESLEDALLNAANSFLTEINKRLMSNLVDQATSSLGNFGMSLFQNKASGGMITGGSGSKDDVPAMLMGGEYVVKKKAVQKYGPDFLNAINNGTLGGYAKGGSVKKPTQTGEGGYFVPGLYDNKSIIGTGDLMSFATQNYTSGARDIISSGENFASINLEQESLRLSQKGRENNPLFAATQAAKEQALGTAFEQMSIEEQYLKAIEEAKRQEKERQKAIRKQLLISSAIAIGSAVAGPLLGAASSGFKAAAGASKAAGGGFFANMGAGLKGVFTGGQLPGITQNVGGLNNLFKGLGQGLTGNFAEAGNLIKLSQIGDMGKFDALYMKNAFANNGKGTPFLDFAQGIGYTPKAINPYSNMGIGLNGGNDFNWFQKVFAPAGSALNNINNSRQRRATGGTIPETSGIDTVPTMLSGGEFIMNRAAAQNIGAGNLQTLNAGASSLPTEEKTEELNDKLISKLDELIQANSSKNSVGEINISVDGSGKSNESSTGNQEGGTGQQLARNIRDMVVKVIQDEQRLGGLLR